MIHSTIKFTLKEKANLKFSPSAISFGKTISSLKSVRALAVDEESEIGYKPNLAQPPVTVLGSVSTN
jgi:hypothetical protein